MTQSMVLLLARLVFIFEIVKKSSMGEFTRIIKYNVIRKKRRYDGSMEAEVSEQDRVKGNH